MNARVLSEFDLVPIVEALDDPSPQVKEAALKVYALLMPQSGDERLPGRVGCVNSICVK